MNRNQPDTSLPKTPAVVIYESNISQYGETPPTEVILYNPEGLTLTWDRDAGGQYRAYIEQYGEYPNFELRECATVTCMASQPGTMTAIQTYNAEIQVYTISGAGYQDGALIDSAFRITLYTNKAKFY